MPWELIDLGGSRSFPDVTVLQKVDASTQGVIILGGDAQSRAHALHERRRQSEAVVVCVELEAECLGLYLDEHEEESSDVLGFARFRMGRAEPSDLVELVRVRATSDAAVAAARGLFQKLELSTVVCADTSGRIVDSLLRPYLNDALNSVDEGLASAPDIDLAVRLGLGYPQGPHELLQHTGLDAHFQVSNELYMARGTPEFVPARQARASAMRKKIGLA